MLYHRAIGESRRGTVRLLSTTRADARQAPLPHLPSAFHGLGERHLVGVLEIAADRQPARDARDAHTERLEQPRQIDRGGLALDARVGGQDHFFDLVVLEPGQQLAHAQVLGPDAVQRGQRAEQDVIAAAELAGALERKQVVGLLHHAERPLLALRIAADAAGILLRHVEADRAVHDELLELGQRLPERRDLRSRALEKEEGQPLGRLRPDARESLERIDQPGDRLRVIRHYNPRPGILSPAVILPISACTISRDLRRASLEAARTRSSSICASSGLMTSRSILIDTSSCLPLATTVTMPPPAVASTVFFAASACICSIWAWSFCASFMMLPKPFTVILLPPGSAAAPRPPRSGMCSARPAPRDGCALRRLHPAERRWRRARSVAPMARGVPPPR